MTDDKDDNQNEKAIEKVVKKSVSDVFGEEEKTPAPQPTYSGPWRGGSYLWEREDQNPGFAFQYPQRQKATSLLGKNAKEAAWGKPAVKTAMRQEFDAHGDVSGVHFTDEGWKKIRLRIFRTMLRELDWERIVLSTDDHVLLEQTLDTVMRRSKFQAGMEGNSFRKGSLAQVPISIGDAPPAGPKPLPASSVELDDDGWGEPAADEDTIEVDKTGEHDADK
jgi:hypothetical protein